MRHERGSVYLAVLGVVSAVTLFTLAGVALRKEINARARAAVSAQDARLAAQSGAELATHLALESPAKFVALATAGKEIYPEFSFDGGTLAVGVVDASTDAVATETTESFRVTTDARQGPSRSRLAFTVQYVEDDLTKAVKAMGAVAYWPLDEQTGSPTAAERIAGYDGTYNKASAVGKQTHAHGNAAPRNYWVDEYTRVPHDDAFELKKGTIVLWAKWDILPSFLAAAVVSKESESYDSDADLAIYLDTSGNLVGRLRERAWLGGGTGGTVEANGVITAGTWHHIALSWGNKLELWVDGVCVAKNTSVDIGLSAGRGVSANERPWYFGVRNRSYSSYNPAYFTYGSVARVALFDRQLGEKEIVQLMEANSMRNKLEVQRGSFARVVD
ncbi:MAG: LamG domain-containing protein [Planctomycetota bacterium]|nr:MAG: LamG domain-containing protein [Planctomycetota bacterium]